MSKTPSDQLTKRMPKAKALAAIERSILVIIFHLLADPTATFSDLGADFYDKRCQPWLTAMLMSTKVGNREH